jgi:hypothetical protein
LAQVGVPKIELGQMEKQMFFGAVPVNALHAVFED